jgi:hypothetical protein
MNATPTRASNTFGTYTDIKRHILLIFCICIMINVSFVFPSKVYSFEKNMEYIYIYISRV